jgi:hypothetical protein
VIAIDLEWKPDKRRSSNNKVAMVQLSSGTCAVLLHTAAMGYTLPAAARAFLASPDIKLLGYSWDGWDERKFQSTFQMGRASFHSFLDLQVS